jgi:hypothetical protein
VSTDSLTDQQQQLLKAIIGGRRAWTPEGSLIRRFGMETLESLKALGWLACWSVDSFGRPLSYASWTLTGWAAEQLRVEIDERVYPSGVEVPYWVELGKANGPIKMQAQPKTTRIPFPDRVPDNSKSTRDYVADFMTREKTRKQSEAARLLNSPVEIDPRLAKRPAKRARRRAKGPNGQRPRTH